MDNTVTPIEPTARQSESSPLTHKRPMSVTLLALGVLIITVLNFIRFVLSIRYWSFISTRVGISPIFLTMSGLVWSVAGLYLLWGLWKAKTWAPRLMQAVALTYAGYYWLDHVFLMEHPVIGATGAARVLLPSNWQFSAGVTVVSLAFMAWTLNRSKVRAYFGLELSKIGQHSQETDDQG